MRSGNTSELIENRISLRAVMCIMKPEFWGCYVTPPIAEIICVKNVGAIVVCGFFMK